MENGRTCGAPGARPGPTLAHPRSVLAWESAGLGALGTLRFTEVVVGGCVRGEGVKLNTWGTLLSEPWGGALFHQTRAEPAPVNLQAWGGPVRCTASHCFQQGCPQRAPASAPTLLLPPRSTGKCAALGGSRGNQAWGGQPADESWTTGWGVSCGVGGWGVGEQAESEGALPSAETRGVDGPPAAHEQPLLLFSL